MSRFENIDHPSVELKLPFDGAQHQYTIPRETTLFFWAGLAPGTPNRISPVDARDGQSLLWKGSEARQQITWSLSIDGMSTPIPMDAHYTKNGYEALAGWMPWDPVELPTTVGVQFKTEGDPPMKDGDQVVFWTEQGERIPWGTTIESSLELLPSDVPAEEFLTRQENLWGRHTVYVPESNR